MGNENNIFNNVFIRLLGLGVQSQKDLADKLKVSTSSVNGAKKRGAFPKKWISILCQLYNKSPEWFLGTQTPPAFTRQEQDKDEIIRLQGQVIRQEEDRKQQESASAWKDKKIKKLEEENAALHTKRGTFTAPAGKTGKNYLNQKGFV